MDIFKTLKKTKNFNKKLINKFKKIQLPIEFKKRMAHFIIRNNFSNKFLKKDINRILKEFR
jgi:dephospho-CoA kinase